jgi:hypothetical protein
LRRQAVDIQGLVVSVAATTEIPIAEVVDEDQQDVRLCGHPACRLRSVCDGTTSKKDEWQGFPRSATWSKHGHGSSKMDYQFSARLRHFCLNSRYLVPDLCSGR